MSFDFDRIIDRKHTPSLKWAHPSMWLTPEQAAHDPLPMWVADMDFEAAPPIRAALRALADYGIWGYSYPLDAYREAVVGWQRRRFGWTPAADSILITPGVVTALNLIVQTFSNAGDAVLIQSPVYGHFHDDVAANGRRVVAVPMALEGEHYRFGAERFEAAITPDVKLFILCNPHNPTGNVWSRAELTAMGEICLRHDVLVVSDEVHEDFIINPALKHVPFAALGNDFAANSIVCTAPSKTFNLAGLQCSNIFVPNPRLRADLQRQVERCGLFVPNLFGLTACEAAYRDGEPWLDALLDYLHGNHVHFAQAVNGKIEGLQVLPADALYLAWMDCRGLGVDADDLPDTFIEKAGLWFDDGRKFGAEGRGFMRVNLACPRTVVDEAIVRMQTAFA